MAGSDERFSIRVAVPIDVDGVLEVQRRSPGRSSTPEFREYTIRAISDPSCLFLVAETASATVGWATTKHFTESDRQAPAGHYLMGVTVAPEFRRHGIATKLVQTRLEWIGQHDDAAYYFTNVHNAASVALHEQLGFRELTRAQQIRGVSFEGGTGILFSLELS